MAGNLTLPSPSGTAAKEGTRSLLFTLGVLTLLSVLVGGGFGLSIVSSIERRVEAKYNDLPQKPVEESIYTSDITIRKLAPVVTNIAGSETDWIRLEASIIYKSGIEFNSEVLAAETRQDVLAYLRTVSLAQIQGPSGLLHLREDLNERARIRSNGFIQEFVLETLVVQ